MSGITQINGAGRTGAAAKTRKASKTFQTTKSDAPAASGAGETATSAPMMSALLTLQSDDFRGGRKGDAKTLAAAQQVLGELERLQHAILEGTPGVGVADSLQRAATLRAHAGADPKLAGLYDEIALRARVELAKLGR